MKTFPIDQQYFIWTDDADPIPFHVNDLGEWVVSGDSLIYMVRVLTGIYEQGDSSPVGPLTPQHVLEQIQDLIGVYQPQADYSILPDEFNATNYSLCTKDGREIHGSVSGVCSCGHAMGDHQTGEGPWTGFCGVADCECDGAREVVWSGDIKERSSDA